MIRNVVLAIILVIQLAAWLIIEPPWSDKEPKSASISGKKLDDLALDKVVTLRIKDSTDRTLELNKRDGIWGVAELHGFPVSADKIEAALKEFEGLSSSDFRSGNAVMHEDYEVDEKTGRHVEFLGEGGETLAHFVLGKRDFQGNMGTFVRQADSDDVYVKRGAGLSTVFSTEAKQWARPGVMDIEIGDQDRLTDLRSACYRIEIEGKAQKKDEEGRPLNPVEWEWVRYVYDRAAEKGEDGEPYWVVKEPSGMEDLVLWDQQLKGLASSMLALRWNKIVGTAVKPEYGLSDASEMAARITCYFKEGDVESRRTLEIGTERDVPTEAGARPSNRKERFANVSHPGDPRLQQFVFTIHETFHTYFTRDPKAMVKRSPSKPKEAAKPAGDG